jgi:hypothetical protein
MPLTRIDLRQLAEIRIAEAGVLVANGMWDGAYYLAGYAVECGLKACIMGYVERTGVIFEDKKYSEKCWTHDFQVLVNLAGLELNLVANQSADPTFEANWEKMRNWSETRRYMRTPEIEARELYDIITEPSHGVLQWIRKQW